MASFDLPRPLPDYFAFAETTPTREGRRFSITLPYLGADGRIGRLQWWYHLSEGKQKILGEEAVQTLRAEAIDRFRTHIERWLEHTAHVLSGEGPIPQLLAQGASADIAQAPPAAVGLALPLPEQNVPSPEQVAEPSGAIASAPVPVAAGKAAFG